MLFLSFRSKNICVLSHVARIPTHIFDQSNSEALVVNFCQLNTIRNEILFSLTSDFACGFIVLHIRIVPRKTGNNDFRIQGYRNPNRVDMDFNKVLNKAIANSVISDFGMLHGLLRTNFLTIGKSIF